MSQPVRDLRDPGYPSARSLLLTVLGEFVHARDGRVWTGTLVDALGALGVEQSHGVGRRVRWQLTDEGAALLAEGAERIYGFLRSPHPWDGRWLVLTVAVPESQRQLRHRLRTRLTWLGLGSPSPGLWVVPDVLKADDVAAVLDELGLGERAFTWAGPAVSGGDPAKLIDAAWDLADVEARYLRFVDRFAATEVVTASEAFVAQVQLVQEWRRFPFLDPDLPRELLDHDWPGARAAATFHDRHDRWHRRAQQEWDRMDDEAGQRS